MKIHTEGISRLSIPLQLAASTVGVGFVGYKIGDTLGGTTGGALGLLAGLILGFFGYIAVIIKREQ